MRIWRIPWWVHPWFLHENYATWLGRGFCVTFPFLLSMVRRKHIWLMVAGSMVLSPSCKNTRNLQTFCLIVCLFVCFYFASVFVKKSRYPEEKVISCYQNGIPLPNEHTGSESFPLWNLDVFVWRYLLVQLNIYSWSTGTSSTCFNMFHTNVCSLEFFSKKQEHRERTFFFFFGGGGKMWIHKNHGPIVRIKVTSGDITP